MVNKMVWACFVWVASCNASWASLPESGKFTGEYQIIMRAAPSGSILGKGVNKAQWTWDFDNDTATLQGTTLSVGFNYGIHDIDDKDKSSDVVHFSRNSDNTITLAYALRIYHPGLGFPMANATTTFRVEQNGAQWKIQTIDREAGDPDGIIGTQIPGVFPLTIEPDLHGNVVAFGEDSNLDGIDDYTALKLGLDPNSLDSDNDGYHDRYEIGADIDNPRDSDGDSVIDALEPNEDANDSTIASGLKTVNEQALTVKVNGASTIVQVHAGSMEREVTTPKDSDDFASLDSTLGQPGLKYERGNIALTLYGSEAEIRASEITLIFGQALPDKLLVYAEGAAENSPYLLIPKSEWRKVTSNAIAISLDNSMKWADARSPDSGYHFVFAVTENTLGGKNVEESKGVVAGSNSLPVFIILLLAGLLRLGRNHKTKPA